MRENARTGWPFWPLAGYPTVTVAPCYPDLTLGSCHRSLRLAALPVAKWRLRDLPAGAPLLFLLPSEELPPQPTGMRLAASPVGQLALHICDFAGTLLLLFPLEKLLVLSSCSAACLVLA